jgi:hypothetical protein
MPTILFHLQDLTFRSHLSSVPLPFSPYLVSVSQLSQPSLPVSQQFPSPTSSSSSFSGQSIFSRFFLRVSVVVGPEGISIYELESENQGYVGLQSYLSISAPSGTRIRTYDRL